MRNGPTWRMQHIEQVTCPKSGCSIVAFPSWFWGSEAEIKSILKDTLRISCVGQSLSHCFSASASQPVCLEPKAE